MGAHRDWYTLQPDGTLKRWKRHDVEFMPYLGCHEYFNGRNGWTDVHDEAECPFRNGVARPSLF